MNKKTIIDWVISIAIAFLLFILIVGVFHPGRVSGKSMYPTYSDRERVFVLRKFYDINRGDVITFWYPKDDPDPDPSNIFGKILHEFNQIVYRQPNLENEELHIKRVIGIPGDHIVVKNEDKTGEELENLQEGEATYYTRVYVNDELVAEADSKLEVSEPGEDCSKGEECDIVLGDDEYFVVGDNYNNSYDSRKHGPIKKSDIFGKIIYSRDNVNEVKQKIE